jgi:hypothetical protein
LISVPDFVRLPYTPDLTRAGISYACRSLAYTYNRMGGSPFDRLRRIVAGKGVELAFRRCLLEQNMPHDNLGATPFTDPDHYDIALGGRRCDLKSFMILKKEEIVHLRRDPGRLLTAYALVPADQLASDNLREVDLYLFAFVTALVTASPGEMERALKAGQPTFCLQTFPQEWMRPAVWASLGKLSAKTSASQGLLLETGGQTGGKEFETERLFLEPNQRASFQKDFYSLAYVYSPRVPAGQVGLYSPRLDQVLIIQPGDWGNIWVYGMEIVLAGYITVGEFRQKAAHLPAGSRAYPYPKTRTDNMALPLEELHPLQELFGRAKEWSRARHPL